MTNYVLLQIVTYSAIILPTAELLFIWWLNDMYYIQQNISFSFYEIKQ